MESVPWGQMKCVRSTWKYSLPLYLMSVEKILKDCFKLSPNFFSPPIIGSTWNQKRDWSHSYSRASHNWDFKGKPQCQEATLYLKKGLFLKCSLWNLYGSERTGALGFLSSSSLVFIQAAEMKHTWAKEKNLMRGCLYGMLGVAWRPFVPVLLSIFCQCPAAWWAKKAERKQPVLCSVPKEQECSSLRLQGLDRGWQPKEILLTVSFLLTAIPFCFVF